MGLVATLSPQSPKVKKFKPLLALLLVLCWWCGGAAGAFVGDLVGGNLTGGTVGRLVGDDEGVVGRLVGLDVGALTGPRFGDDVGLLAVGVDAEGPLVGDDVGFEVVGVVDFPIFPGEPVSVSPGLGLAELKAPFTPTTLSVEMMPLRPAELSKVCRFGGGVEAPNVTLASGTPAALNRFTASPLVESPTPAPE